MANAGAAEERDKLLEEKLTSVDELAELKLRLEEATEYEAQVEVLAEENADLAEQLSQAKRAPQISSFVRI